MSSAIRTAQRHFQERLESSKEFRMIETRLHYWERELSAENVVDSYIRGEKEIPPLMPPVEIARLNR
jgi:hypothetical protein